MNFIIDTENNSQLSYNNLLSIINNNETYYKIWKYPNFTEFVINLIKALITNNDIVLIDKDYTKIELSNIGYDDYFLESKININVKNLDELINLVKNSKSSITIFTSGTTGVPKKVTHGVSSLIRMFRKTDNCIWAMCYNPVHIAGLHILFQSLLNLNTIIYLFDQDFIKIRENINKYNVTHISATPTFYKLLIGSSNNEYKSVVRVTIGGESSNINLYNSIKKYFTQAKINNIYASSEIGSLFVSENDIFKIPKSIFDKVKIENNELLVHKSLISIEISEEWYKTGDEVIIVSEDEFKFSNRKNDIINVGGYKVNPIEVENLISELNGIIDVRVYGRKNSVTGNLICAEIFSEDSSIDDKKIKNYLSDKLQTYKIPKIITFVDKTKFNKNQKKERK
jgi:acyl-coenzyme A synthetase/AMP-(fatty) acid ligase